MLARVKTPRIDIEAKGEIPDELLEILNRLFRKDLTVSDDGEELIDIRKTEWYRQTKKSMTPGSWLRAYRNKKGWTQTQLGEKLDGISKQDIYHLEKGSRGISKAMAKKLAKIFNVPAGRFI